MNMTEHCGFRLQLLTAVAPARTHLSRAIPSPWGLWRRSCISLGLLPGRVPPSDSLPSHPLPSRSPPKPMATKKYTRKRDKGKHTSSSKQGSNKGDSSFFHPIPSSGGGEFGGGVRSTFLGIALVSDCLAVGAKRGSVWAASPPWSCTGAGCICGCG